MQEGERPTEGSVAEGAESTLLIQSGQHHFHLNHLLFGDI